jgi:endonuclease III
MTPRSERVARLLEVGRPTYAQQAGIRLADTPAPLYQLLVMSLLLSTRISADIAIAATRELRRAGYTTARRMLAATWQQRVDALGRGHYRRYDESTATRLGQGAELLVEHYRGDLRRLADAADHQPPRIAELLRELPGIGPVGADIYLREVQAVWPWVRPYAGERVASAAAQVGLPSTARGLASAAGTDDLSALSAALIRVTLDKDLRAKVG